MRLKVPVHTAVRNVGRLFFPVVSLLAERQRYIQTYRDMHVERLIAASQHPFPKARVQRSELIITWYIPSVVDIYSRLLGKRISTDQRKGLSLLSIFSTAYDDLFDEQGITQTHLQRVLTDSSYTPASSEEQLAKVLYGELVRLPPALDNALFTEAFAQQHATQFASLAQKSSSISGAELERITHAKGGVAQVLIHSLVNRSMSPGEQAATYELGAWGQLVNDCADIYKDRAQGVSTLMTQSSTFEEALGWLEKYRLRFFARYRALPEYTDERKEQFLFEYYVICAAMVARLREGYAKNPATRRPRRKRDWLPAALAIVSRYDRASSEQPMHLPPAI